MANLAGHFFGSTNAELGNLYPLRATGDFRDVSSGSAGGFSCLVGWDFVTGVGSPQGTQGL